MRNCESFTTFKTKLNTFLFKPLLINIVLQNYFVIEPFIVKNSVFLIF